MVSTKRFLLPCISTLVILVSRVAAEDGEEFGSVYTFPVKSINLEAAAQPKWYATYGTIVEDAHAVEGTPLREAGGKQAGYAMCGKGMQSEKSSKQVAFAFRVDADGKLMWTWRASSKSENVANAVVQLPSRDGKTAGDLIVVGMRVYGSAAKRSITKLDFATGKEAWTVLFGDTKGNHGAFEMASLSADGESLFVSGLYKKKTMSEFWFKSYGNAPGGKAIAHKLKVSELQKTSKPTVASLVEWTITFDDKLQTAKDIAELPVSGNIAVMLWSEELEDADVAIAIVKASDGSPVWTKYYSDTNMEPTDFAVHASKDGKKDFIALTGHGGNTRGISSRLAKVDGADGKLLFTKSFSAGGTPELIYNECWGIGATADGYVLGCGTGIEGCEHVSGSMRKDCLKGIGDKRQGAYPRKPAIWQSMVIKTDLNGNLLWQRVDAFKAPGAKEMGAPGWLQDSSSSACEWIMLSEDKIVALNDETNGVGLLALDYATGVPIGSTKKPTQWPTKRPTKMPTKMPTRKTRMPTQWPTKRPTRMPTKWPTRKTRMPTKWPTRKPTRIPTQWPTRQPTVFTTMAPSPNLCAQFSSKNTCRRLRFKNTDVAVTGKYRYWGACVWKHKDRSCLTRDHCKMLRTSYRCKRFGKNAGCAFVKGKGCHLKN